MDVTLVNTAVRATSDSSQNHAPAPHLVLVLESRRPAGMSARYRLDAVDEIILGRGKQRTAERRLEDGIRRLIIQVPDPWMSSRHARIERRGSLFLFQDMGSTNGSMINGAAITSSHLQDGDTLELGQTFFLFRQELAVSPVDSRDLDVGELTAPPGLISLVPRLSQKLFELAQVSRTSASVVVQGETGTGKEVIASSSHTLSGRSGGFVAVNCGALPDALVESELFGYKKGAFSGATEARQGFVQAADHGTLFLDEIGDLPLSSQAVLLRVLQEREVTPVGSTKPIPVDFRLVSATHRDMEGLVREGRFREDLLARLSGFTIELPPLRERMEDMGILIASLLAPLCAEHGREFTLSNDAMRALLLYSWPRNVRELRTCLQTAAALAADGKIHLQHLSQPVRNNLDCGSGSTARGSADSGSTGTSEVRQRAATQGPSVTIQEQRSAGQEQRSAGHEQRAAGQEQRAAGQRPLSPAQQGRRDKLVALLREHQGNVSAVARSMGKVRSQVQRWLKRYGLDPDSFRDS